MKVTVRSEQTPGVAAEIDEMRRELTRRAYAIFQRRGNEVGRAFEHWLAAEKELTWKPAVELFEHDGELVIEAAVAGVEPKELDIQITPEDMLIKAKIHHEHPAERGTVYLCEFEAGELFRSVHFPKRVAPERATATCRNGLLKVRIPIATEAQRRRVQIEAA